MTHTDNARLQKIYAEAASAPLLPLDYHSLTAMERLAALQRKFALAHPGEPIPDTEDLLWASCVNPALREGEAMQMLNGMLHEAQRALLVAFNTSQTLTAFADKCKAGGLSHALETFDPETQASLKDAIRYLAP